MKPDLSDFLAIKTIARMKVPSSTRRCDAFASQTSSRNPALARHGNSARVLRGRRYMLNLAEPGS